MTDLKKWLDFAYKTVSMEVHRQSRGLHKSVYDLRVRESQLQPGDRVLARNFGVRRKMKIADRWEKDVYLVVDQPNKGIPVCIVKREHGKGKRRMLHRALLLRFMGLPASKPNLLGTSVPAGSTQPLSVATTETVDSDDQVNLADTLSNDEVSPAKS